MMGGRWRQKQVKKVFSPKKHAEPTENPTLGIVNFITGGKKIKQKKKIIINISYWLVFIKIEEKKEKEVSFHF